MVLKRPLSPTNSAANCHDTITFDRAGSLRVPKRRAGHVVALFGITVGVVVLAASAAGACTNGQPGKHGPSVSAAFSHGRTLDGMIGSVGTSSFTLTDHNGITWTVNVTSQTIYMSSSGTLNYSALSDGERVRVEGSVVSGSPDTYLAAEVKVPLVHLSGTIVSSAPGTFTLADNDNFWRVVVETSSTTYSIGPKAVAISTTAASLVPGLRVRVSGTVDANHTSLDAVAVDIELSKLLGTVTSVSAGGFALQTRGGAISVTTSPSTAYFDANGTLGSSAIVVGASVVAFGSQSGSGMFSASFVGIGQPRSAMPFGYHPGSRQRVLSYLASYLPSGSPCAGRQGSSNHQHAF